MEILKTYDVTDMHSAGFMDARMLVSAKDEGRQGIHALRTAATPVQRHNAGGLLAGGMCKSNSAAAAAAISGFCLPAAGQHR